eukprot:9259476-Prorocentrum_lima.AAC.1
MPPDMEHSLSNCGPRVALLNPNDEKHAKYQCCTCKERYLVGQQWRRWCAIPGQTVRHASMTHHRCQSL